MQRLYPACLVTALALLSACNEKKPPKPEHPRTAQFAAEIRRTAFGIPHIKAHDEAGLGFGVGYAYAQDNVCLMADQIATVSSERSRHFGPDASGDTAGLTNLQTDFFHALISDAAAVDTAWKAQPEPMKALIEGYVAGYNLYLEQTGRAGLPEACKDAAWVRKMTTADFVRLVRSYAAEGGSVEFANALVAAAPPATASAVPAAPLKALDAAHWRKKRERTGSNGVALGKDATINGGGLLLANPHFPWQGKLRFYQLHLTIPGKLDVMGASLGGLPQVNIGFNQHVAWTHTVNTSSHFTLHLLKLDPADPTRYMVDGQSREMTRKEITVQVKGTDGVVRPRTHTFYTVPEGQLVSSPGTIAWTREHAFVLQDANLGNHRLLEQWYAIGQARSVADIESAVDRVMGLPWVNTVAADHRGDTLYMDVTVVPHVTAARQAACVPAPFVPYTSFGIMILDASTSACGLGDDRAAPQRGIFAGASLPRLRRTDYVQNANDSAWLSNPAAPLTGFPSIVSIDNTPQQGRTRLGISQLQSRLAGTDGQAGKLMSMGRLQELALSNRVYYADLVMADLLRACAADPALGAACATLAAWDRTANLDANLGYAYFAAIWRHIGAMPELWAVPFDPADPVNTPRGLNVADPAVALAVRQAIAAAMEEGAELGIPPGARWGDLQGVQRGASWIPIHGGDGELGVYNSIESAPRADGRLHVMFGTSFIQTVEFDGSGPRAQALLSYSQSANPASKHYGDQTARFSAKAWITQAFTEAQITADPAYSTISIKAPR